MRREGARARQAIRQGRLSSRDGWAEFWRTPLVMRAYLTVVAIAAVVLPIALSSPVRAPHSPAWLTVTALLLVSVLNIEIGRRIAGGLARTEQPHKALSAWAFASAMLLPIWWLLVVVPITYAHARWRGIRLPLWKWVGSGLYLVLCGVAAGCVRAASLGTDANWSQGDGHRGFVTMLLAAVVFLAVETVLFTGSALLNDADDERWLRAMLTDRSFYATEAGVLLLGGLFSMVWAAGFWFTLFFLPLHVLIQQAVLVGPMRERAAVATELASKNTRLEELNEQLALSNAELAKANQFQADLLGMLGHEIANPLTSVLGHSEILAEALHDDDHALALRAADAVDRNAQRVAVVLGDIITLLASESGVITASPQRVALRERLDAAVADLQDSERPPVECAPDLHVHVQPGHLDQILANLLSNAVKYGCGASRIAAKAADDSVEITVADRGRGVPEEFTDHLFERYRRDDRTSAKVPGTGLGLFISRELARANGGDVTHHNEHAHGARFVLTLPTA